MNSGINPFMRRAIELCREGLRRGDGGPFGAVIVRDGAIVGEGCNQVLLRNDPTAHAEIVAIRDAAKKLSKYWLQGCEIYTSAEPCPMCLGAIYWARLSRIYYANSIEDADKVGADDLRFYKEFAKPSDQREVPMVHVDDPQAWKVFEEWAADQQRKKY
jgi:tRNA(Arg) A34 adenosine deaminase TadA